MDATISPTKLYLRLLRIAIHRRMQYRADFMTGIVGVVLMNVSVLTLISILVSRFKDLGGWTMWQMVFLYCMWMMAHSIFGIFMRHTRTLEDYLIQGTFDQFLMRPASAFVLLLGREVSYIGLGDMAFGVGGIVLSYRGLGLQWGVGLWAYFFVAIISGAIIEGCILLSITCIAFWSGRSRRAEGLAGQVNNLVQYYPVRIFGAGFQVLVTGILPFAFLNYYPSMALLGKVDAANDPFWWLAYAGPVVAAIMLYITSRVWTYALDHYSSSGS